MAHASAFSDLLEATSIAMALRGRCRATSAAREEHEYEARLQNNPRKIAIRSSSLFHNAGVAAYIVRAFE